MFAAHGLRLFDVEELPTHGGSLRIFGAHDDDETKVETDARASCWRASEAAGLRRPRHLPRRTPSASEADKRADPQPARSSSSARATRSPATARRPRATRCSTTAASGRDLIDYTVDPNPHKQGHLLPGTHIPIRSPEALRETRPDVVLILPWNLRDEIMQQLAYIREWGGRFAARTPELTLLT